MIRVVGVGGAGVNAVNRMVEAGIAGVEFLAVNTDMQSLQQSDADITVHIGEALTRGLGAGANPELGRAAAMEDYDRIKHLLKGSDMVFIAAGAGGGTGTGAAPIVARIAQEIGALTVGIITKPFGFEGTRRASSAQVGIDALGAEVDTLIVVPNNRLLQVLDQRTSMVEAFRVADDVLRQGVQGVSDLVTLPGHHQPRLRRRADDHVRGGAGAARHRHGRAATAARWRRPSRRCPRRCSRRAWRARAPSCCRSPVARTCRCGRSTRPPRRSAEAAHPEANIIFGAMVDESLEDQVWVTVVATRYGDTKARTTTRRRIEEPAGEPRVRAPRTRAQRRQHRADRHGCVAARRARVRPARMI